jgi:hypothetical protein
MSAMVRNARISESFIGSSPVVVESYPASDNGVADSFLTLQVRSRSVGVSLAVSA